MRLFWGILFLAVTSIQTQAISFQILTHDNIRDSKGFGISDDGSTIFGTARSLDDSFGIVAVKWDVSDGSMTVLPDTVLELRGFTLINGVPVETYSFLESQPFDISSDGSKIIGLAEFTDRVMQPFVWTEESGMQQLHVEMPPQFRDTHATGISGDGAKVVGWFDTTPATVETSYIWTESGTSPLIVPSMGGLYHYAAGISADGSTVIGHFQTRDSWDIQAFRWTAQEGLQSLGDLPGGRTHSFATAANSNGSTIVGFGSPGEPGADGPFDGVNQVAFIWSKENGMRSLGSLSPGEPNSRAYGVNGDGTVVVGETRSPDSNKAFIWTEERGMRSIGQMLEQNGEDLAEWSLLNATGISSDGKKIVGTAYRTENTIYNVEYAVWIATIPEPTASFWLLSGLSILYRRRQNV
ncbi:MAG: hypothetical protein RIG82_09165 [Phycisphaeraceae bacterium]